MRVSLTMGLLLWGFSSTGQAADFAAGVGSFTENTKSYPLYLLELKQDKKNISDFEVGALAHSSTKETVYDVGQILYQGFGFDFDPLRLNLELGYSWSLDKFVLDEVDYGISHSVVGGRIVLNIPFLQVFGAYRSYRPTWSPKTTIDSFEITFNPSPFQWVRAGVLLNFKAIELSAEAGQFRNLKGRFDILGDGYTLELNPVSYQKAALQLNSQQKTYIRAEWHQFVQDQGNRLLFQKLTGSSLNREAFYGGIIALGIAN